MSLFCGKFLRFHVWFKIDPEKVTWPKVGLYDPRTDSERTRTVAMEVCGVCGEKRERSDSDEYFL